MSLKIRRISGCSISPASNSALVLRNATDIAPIATASAASIESSVGCVATPDDKGPGGEVKLPPGDFDWTTAWTAEAAFQQRPARNDAATWRQDLKPEGCDAFHAQPTTNGSPQDHVA